MGFKSSAAVIVGILSIAAMTSASPGSPPGPRPAEGADFYGSGIQTDGLGNIPLGSTQFEAPYSVEISLRFRAQHTGQLRAIRVYLMFGEDETHPSEPGYSGGSGGTVRVEIRRDDGTANHAPVATAFGTAVHRNPIAAGIVPQIAFPAPLPRLEAGRLYHLVFANGDRDPKTNFVSLNFNWYEGVRGRRQPTYSDTDLFTLLRLNGGPWTDATATFEGQNHTPVFELDYADNFVEGRSGYIEVWGDSPHQISGPQQVRETFRVTGRPRRVSRVSVRVARRRGTEPLIVRLERADGARIDQGPAVVSSAPTTTGYVWMTYAFPSPRMLLPGQTYNLVLLAPSTSAYETIAMRKGEEDDLFSPGVFFADGRAEQTTPAGWADWIPYATWGEGVRRADADLQFYFVLTP